VTKSGLELKFQYDGEVAKRFSSQTATVRLAYRF